MRPERARASIRFSLGKQNTAEEVEFALALVPETVARLRELSPVWKELRAASLELRAPSDVSAIDRSLLESSAARSWSC